MSAMLENPNGYICFNDHKCITFQQILIKLCIYASHLLALHYMDSLSGMQELLFLIKVKLRNLPLAGLSLSISKIIDIGWYYPSLFF